MTVFELKFSKFKEFEAITPNERVQRIGTLRTKYIEISYCYIREARWEGTIHLQYCSTSEMTADLPKKPLARGRV